MAKSSRAHSVAASRCIDCDAAHIYLFDADGEVLAEAILSDDHLIGFANDMVDLCNDIFGRSDTIGRTLGEA